ncbi:hypothetical protein EHQ53_09240 [Leptospira langatensis]|uniref:Uncharacterized protein n=1 Tax=Leptospira langatensis TaxID=2484983 RepID=A0A5F1ZV65_9LEPT|nr:hypothetical protein [Leptospira langatensis]TGK01199.1 hypothetical protein EHO57_09635 [Leptospira langatensis]TGL42350.1 hypothetical protein EHQ53_09240 [Leptospira langatensis]
MSRERILALQTASCFLILLSLFFFYMRDPFLEESAYSIRQSVLEETPIRSSKSRVMRYLKSKGITRIFEEDKPYIADPSYVADILLFNKKGIIQSNPYFIFRQDNNHIRAELGSYIDLTDSRFWLRPYPVRVFLYFQFWNNELVQVRAIKAF